MEFFLEAMDIKDATTILDIGAGGGFLWSEFCLIVGLNLIGLDLAKSGSDVILFWFSAVSQKEKISKIVPSFLI